MTVKEQLRLVRTEAQTVNNIYLLTGTMFMCRVLVVWIFITYIRMSQDGTANDTIRNPAEHIFADGTMKGGVSQPASSIKRSISIDDKHEYVKPPTRPTFQTGKR